jgi:hypothetical protein
LYRNDALFAPFGAVLSGAVWFGAVRRGSARFLRENVQDRRGLARFGAVRRGSVWSGAERFGAVRSGATYAVSPKHLRSPPTLRRTAPRVVYRAEQRRNTPNQLEANAFATRVGRCADGFPQLPVGWVGGYLLAKTDQATCCPIIMVSIRSMQQSNERIIIYPRPRLEIWSLMTCPSSTRHRAHRACADVYSQTYGTKG